MLLAELEFRDFEASRQLQVGQVDDVANVEVGQIDFDELRQILRQARNDDLVEFVRDRARQRSCLPATFPGSGSAAGRGS